MSYGCRSRDFQETEGINPEYARSRANRRGFFDLLAEITRDVVEFGGEDVAAWWVEEMQRLKRGHSRDFDY